MEIKGLQIVLTKAVKLNMCHSDLKAFKLLVKIKLIFRIDVGVFFFRFLGEFSSHIITQRSDFYVLLSATFN